LNREEFEEFVRRNPEEALRLIVKAFKPKELLKIGNRSYANAFKYPESRFDPKDLMLNGGSLQVLKGDMLQPLRDPSKSFTDQVLIPPSQLVFSLAGRTYSKSGMPETAGMISGGLTDASTVIQKAFDNCPARGVVALKGEFIIKSRPPNRLCLTKPRLVNIIGYAKLKLADNLNDNAFPLLQCEAGDHQGTIVASLELDGNEANNRNWSTAPFAQGLYGWERASNLKVIGVSERVKVRDLYIHDTVESCFLPGSHWIAENLHLKNSQNDHLLYADSIEKTIVRDVLMEGFFNTVGIVIGANCKNSMFEGMVLTNPANNPKGYSMTRAMEIRGGGTGYGNRVKLRVIGGNYDLTIVQPKTVFDIEIYYDTASQSPILRLFRPDISGRAKIRVTTTNRTIVGYLVSLEGNNHNNDIELDLNVEDNRAYYRLVLVNPTENITGVKLKGLIRNTGAAGVIGAGSYTSECDLDDLLIKSLSGYEIVDNGLIKLRRNRGIATFSGDGTTTTFNIPHKLSSTPSKYIVSPLTPDAHASKTITADATNIVITFATAPPAGTNNLKFGWYAEV